MKIQVIKLACSKDKKGVAFAIDKHGRLYENRFGKWNRYRTFCNRYENREYFDLLSRYRKTVSGQLTIEVPEL